MARELKVILLYQPSQTHTIPRKSPTPLPCFAPSHLPPLSKVRCCRPKKFGRLPEGLPHQPSPRTQPSQNRIIPFAFRRVSVCVCLVGFASLQSPWAHTLRHPCLFMNALLALLPCKAFGRSFQASLPCLLLPLHRTSLFPQPLQKDNNPSPHTQPFQIRTIPRKSPTPLPPLSKGGGLTARHKLLLCCV